MARWIGRLYVVISFIFDFRMAYRNKARFILWKMAINRLYMIYYLKIRG